MRVALPFLVVALLVIPGAGCLGEAIPSGAYLCGAGCQWGFVCDEALDPPVCVVPSALTQGTDADAANGADADAASDTASDAASDSDSNSDSGPACPDPCEPGPATCADYELIACVEVQGCPTVQPVTPGCAFDELCEVDACDQRLEWEDKDFTLPPQTFALWVDPADITHAVGDHFSTCYPPPDKGCNWLGASTIYRAIWGAASLEAWLVDAAGVHRWDDGLVSLASPSEQPLYDVDGFDADSVWAVGDAGTVLRYDGLAWLPVPDQPEALAADLRVAVALGDDDVIVAGADQTIWRWTDGAWSDHSLGGEATFNGGFGLAPDVAWLVDAYGDLWRYNGVVWSKVWGLSRLHDVWATSPSNLWVVGLGGAHHYDGESWTQVIVGGEWRAVDGRNRREVWLAGEDATEGWVVRRLGLPFDELWPPR